MSLHKAEFDYLIPEYAILEMEIDDALDREEKERVAIQEIREAFPEVEHINLLKLESIDG